MGKLVQRLRDASRSGVYRASRAEEIMDTVRDSELFLAKIRFGPKEMLLKEIAAALEFPDSFGGNWDALEDCLSELPRSGYVVVFEKPEPGDELGVLVDILRSSAEWWASRGKPFFAVFIDPARRLRLPDLFTEK